VDETLANIKAQGLQIIGWMFIEDQQLMKLNLKTDVEPHMVKINAQLENKQGAGSGTTLEGIQRCFCMDIQRYERDFAKVSTTQN
jgi:hypothetical protein